MTNTDIRTLKIFEFNRALSYVSEIIEIERKIEKLETERKMLKLEQGDWEKEEAETAGEIRDIEQIVKTIVGKCAKNVSKQEDLQKYLKELKHLLSNILEFVIGDSDLELKKEEIQISFLEEYVYLLSEYLLEGESIIIERLFENKADLAILIFESYGRERE